MNNLKFKDIFASFDVDYCSKCNTETLANLNSTESDEWELQIYHSYYENCIFVVKKCGNLTSGFSKACIENCEVEIESANERTLIGI